jgi:hypothetical protein
MPKVTMEGVLQTLEESITTAIARAEDWEPENTAYYLSLLLREEAIKAAIQSNDVAFVEAIRDEVMGNAPRASKSDAGTFDSAQSTTEKKPAEPTNHMMQPKDEVQEKLREFLKMLHKTMGQ